MRPLLVALALLGALAAPAARAFAASDDPYRSGGGDARLDAVSGAVRFGIPEQVEISPTALVVEVPVFVNAVGVGGRVDRIDFADFAINGVPFAIEPYDASFDLPEEGSTRLPRPLRLRLDFASAAPGVLEETLYPSDQISLTGRATVEGTFKKWIFSVHRAVEIPVEATGRNPLAKYHPARYVLDHLDTLTTWPF